MTNSDGSLSGAATDFAASDEDPELNIAANVVQPPAARLPLKRKLFPSQAEEGGSGSSEVSLPIPNSISYSGIINHISSIFVEENILFGPHLINLKQVFHSIKKSIEVKRHAMNSKPGLVLQKSSSLVKIIDHKDFPKRKSSQRGAHDGFRYFFQNS